MQRIFSLGTTLFKSRNAMISGLLSKRGTSGRALNTDDFYMLTRAYCVSILFQDTEKLPYCLPFPSPSPGLIPRIDCSRCNTLESEAGPKDGCWTVGSCDSGCASAAPVLQASQPPSCLLKMNSSLASLAMNSSLASLAMNNSVERENVAKEG